MACFFWFVVCTFYLVCFGVSFMAKFRRQTTVSIFLPTAWPIPFTAVHKSGKLASMLPRGLLHHQSPDSARHGSAGSLHLWQPSSPYCINVLVVNALQSICLLVPSACVAGTENVAIAALEFLNRLGKNIPKAFLKGWACFWAAVDLCDFLRFLAVFCHHFMTADFIHAFFCIDQFLSF